MNPPDFSLSPPNTHNGVLSVSELNARARQVLEQQIPLLWIAGEISNLTYVSSGHVYFSLKDASAQVRCTLWRSRAQLLPWRLQNGEHVEVRARPSLYEARGEFQLNVESVRQAGQGQLFTRFLALKNQLEAEGLFAPERKRALPKLARRVAIVTSPQAAALRDVLVTLSRRAPWLESKIFPTQVQGEGAAAQIAQSLKLAGAMSERDACDLIILCRGGGSIEDLWAFNEEAVARAIVASPIPVISGIGHETDFTIADFAADVRAATPTAAAELACPDGAALQQQLQHLASQLHYRYERVLGDKQQQLDHLSHRLRHPAQTLAQQGIVIENLQQRLQAAMRHAMHGNYSRFGQLEASIRQLDPLAVLGRGYALASTVDGQVVRDSSMLHAGSPLRLQFARGEVLATVDHVVPPTCPTSTS